MDRYIVTGAAGFIASVVSQKLLDSGAEVVGIDNMNQAYDVRMKEYRLKKLKENLRFINAANYSTWDFIRKLQELQDQIDCLTCKKKNCKLRKVYKNRNYSCEWYQQKKVK